MTPDPSTDQTDTKGTSQLSAEQICTLASDVLRIEANAIQQLINRIDDRFVQACHCILNCSGRIAVTGIGKSGHIAGKIAATLASTGTPAFFVHPTEAGHGDLGMLMKDDVMLMLSNSGETEELKALLPGIKRIGVAVIVLTGKPGSTLTQHADVILDVSVNKEACPLGLAPTSSTTASLAMGDALAISLLEARGFTNEDFARAHPSGALGRRLLLRIADVMHKGEDVPQVTAETNLMTAIVQMTEKRLGMVAVIDHQQRLLGVFTDGDLRRAIDEKYDLATTRIDTLMTANPVTLAADALATEAVLYMQQHKIQGLLVTDKEVLIGALNFHDLLQHGVV